MGLNSQQLNFLTRILPILIGAMVVIGVSGTQVAPAKTRGFGVRATSAAKTIRHYALETRTHRDWMFSRQGWIDRLTPGQASNEDVGYIGRTGNGDEEFDYVDSEPVSPRTSKLKVAFWTLGSLGLAYATPALVFQEPNPAVWFEENSEEELD